MILLHVVAVLKNRKYILFSLLTRLFSAEEGSGELRNWALSPDIRLSFHGRVNLVQPYVTKTQGSAELHKTTLSLSTQNWNFHCLVALP